MNIVKKENDAIKINAHKDVIDKALSGIKQSDQEQQNLVKMVVTQAARTYYTNDDLQEAADNILSHN